VFFGHILLILLLKRQHRVVFAGRVVVIVKRFAQIDFSIHQAAVGELVSQNLLVVEPEVYGHVSPVRSNLMKPFKWYVKAVASS
jgi:hypothetical protein